MERQSRRAAQDHFGPGHVGSGGDWGWQMTEGNRRVLILVENESVPFDRRVWEESRTLAEAGYRVVVVCPRDSDRGDTEPYVELEGVQIHRFRLRFARHGPGYAREYVSALWHSLRITLRLQRQEPFDVVHVCNPPDLMILAALPLKAVGSRLIFDQHDVVPELYLSRFPGGSRLLHRLLTLLERLAYAAADVVIATNESYRRIALERGRVAPDRVFVVRNGPNLDRFVPVDPDPRLKRGKEHLVCYIGVIGHHDGVDHALRALAHLRHGIGRTDFHAVFIGFGDALESCIGLARELRLGDCVEFTGRGTDEVLQRYLSTADVCLSPDPQSPFNDVSTMMKIMEYMSMSRPIVSFDLTESRFSAGEAAVYAHNDDEEEFARLIAKLLDAPEQRAEMGAAGRRRVEQSLSWNASRQQLLQAYDFALAHRPPTGAGTRVRRLIAGLVPRSAARRHRQR
jgi:glycosyltransferase involved in cell wall biosynthesis